MAARTLQEFAPFAVYAAWGSIAAGALLGALSGVILAHRLTRRHP